MTTKKTTKKSPKKQNAQQLFWNFARKGLFLSAIVTVVLLILPLRDIIVTLLKGPDALNQLAATSSFWQRIVKYTTNLSVSTRWSDALPFVVFIGAGLLLMHSISTGHRRILRETKANSKHSARHRMNITASRNTIARSLLINIPLLYWGVFLFWIVPMLAKMPLSALSTGEKPVLLAVSAVMLLATAALTHIGMLLARFSIQFIDPE